MHTAGDSEQSYSTADPEVDQPALLSASAATIALVSMPFLTTSTPSIQLGLLKAIAAERGHSVSALHLHLDFAAQIGHELYETLCQRKTAHLGEWLFSLAAFEADAPDSAGRFLDDLPTEAQTQLDGYGLTRLRLNELRQQEIPKYLAHLLATVEWQSFGVVGFSSSFEQNCACFALARQLKLRYPQMIIIFGGANFDGEMGPEWVRSMPFIDYAVVGEGDEAFPELLDALAAGGDAASVPGVVGRRDGQVVPARSRPLVTRLDQTPVPDYHDYFKHLDALGFLPPEARRSLRIPFESARGCWWGAKHHCTFCGLNGNSLAFRAKSPERVMAELAEQARRHRCFEFFAVDNILEPAYLKDFFARLTEMGSDYGFFYEVKSNLTRAQLKVLRDGGVRAVQPGIESLSTPVLTLMRKGVTSIQNVNLLRWAKYYDIFVYWNLLHGFPGERVEHYQEQAALMRKLSHLQPPGDHAIRISMQRFSPIFNDRASFPVRSMAPDDRYACIYPNHVDMTRAAYYFDHEFEHELPESALDETQDVLSHWSKSWESSPQPRMQFRHAPSVIEIEDRRDPKRPRAYSVEGTAADLYAACSDQPRSPASLKRLLNPVWNTARIQQALADFESLGLMMREGSRFLSLALPATAGR